MSQASSQRRRSHPLSAAAIAGRVSDRTFTRIDPEGLKRVATISVWLHWSVAVFFLIQMLYRPTYGMGDGLAYWLLLALLVGFNGSVHYRLRSRRPMTWRWILGLIATDVIVLSVAVAIGGGFNHFFFHLLYYAILAGYAVVFTSFSLTMAWVTVVAGVYLGISVTVGNGVDIERGFEKALLARVFVMYVVAAAVNLISSFERTRWQAAVERERALQRERLELSQAIHDTTAQSAYMIGLGIDAAKKVAGNTNAELTARLDATALLSKTAIWQLRHPIDMGRLFEGRELGRTLDSHLTTFTSITSVAAELVLTGTEPPLPIEVKRILFTIAHNALTNAFRHAQADRVLLELNFAKDELRLTVADDGRGLPANYADRGHGFTNMRADAERLGGRLLVEPRGALRGASVTCAMRLGPSGPEG